VATGIDQIKKDSVYTSRECEKREDAERAMGLEKKKRKKKKEVRKR
jgi:hypothetical protein